MTSSPRLVSRFRLSERRDTFQATQSRIPRAHPRIKTEIVPIKELLVDECKSAFIAAGSRSIFISLVQHERKETGTNFARLTRIFENANEALTTQAVIDRAITGVKTVNRPIECSAAVGPLSQGPYWRAAVQ